jgi:hypothetical protein
MAPASKNDAERKNPEKVGEKKPAAKDSNADDVKSKEKKK